jgi:hypothetical protein
MKKTLVVLLFVVAIAACKTAVVTPEGTEAGWSTAEGVLRAQLGASMTDVVNATTATLTDLELVGIDSTVDQLKGKITARLAVGTKVKIHLESTGFDTTAIKIKVGTWGDRSISLQILRNIEKRLEQ